MARPTPPSPTTDEARTGLPVLRTWRAVYTFVVVTFLAWVALLSWLTLHYA